MKTDAGGCTTSARWRVLRMQRRLPRRPTGCIAVSRRIGSGSGRVDLPRFEWGSDYQWTSGSRTAPAVTGAV